MGFNILDGINNVSAALGKVPGVFYTRKYGINTDVDSALEMLTPVGDFTFQTSAQSLEIVSSSVQDENPGTGAWSVKVFGIDANYIPIAETVLLTGTVAKALTKQYRFVHRAFVTGLAGTGKTNAGNLTIRVAGGGATMAYIPSGLGQTQQLLFMSPAESVMVIKDLSITCNNVPNVSQLSLRVMSVNQNGVKKLKWSASFPDNLGRYHEEGIICTCGEKEIIYVEVSSSVGNSNLTGGMDVFVMGSNAQYFNGDEKNG